MKVPGGLAVRRVDAVRIVPELSIKSVIKNKQLRGALGLRCRGTSPSCMRNYDTTAIARASPLLFRLRGRYG